MEAAAEEPEQEQTSDVSIALALVSSREEGFSLTASSGGAGRERTASASLVLGRSCCADSDVTAEVPAVGTGSIWMIFSARVIAPTSPRVSPLFPQLACLARSSRLWRCRCAETKGGWRVQAWRACALCNGECTLRAGIPCAKACRVCVLEPSPRGLTCRTERSESPEGERGM